MAIMPLVSALVETGQKASVKLSHTLSTAQVAAYVFRLKAGTGPTEGHLSVGHGPLYQISSITSAWNELQCKRVDILWNLVGNRAKRLLTWPNRTLG